MADGEAHDLPHGLNDVDASTDGLETTNPWVSDSSTHFDASNGELNYITDCDKA